MRASVASLCLAMALSSPAAAAEKAGGLRGTQVSLTAQAERPTAYMRVYAMVRAPMGFVQFCEVFPKDCEPGQAEETRVVLTADLWSELDRTNRTVNREVQPVSDLDNYGVEEWWSLPLNGKGDCEDYALMKRHLLMERGWPPSALLMTVVRDEKGDGHAILTARTAQGDFILDNKTSEIKLWHATTYKYVMRQSFINPRAWMSLDPKEAVTPPNISGNRTQP